MVNSNYLKGRRKEYRIVKKYKKLGYDIVQRTAGSRSPLDVFAINFKEKIILFIQSKPDDWGRDRIMALRDKNKDLNGVFDCRFIVI